MAVRGLDNVDGSNKNPKGNKKNKIILTCLAALALLSLLIFLGNPGIWTPDEDHGPGVEATDDSSHDDSADSDQTEPVANATAPETIIVTESNQTVAVGDSSARDFQDNSQQNGFGYVITYGTVSNDTGSSSGGSRGGGGGGGGGGHNSGGGSNQHTNSSPVAKNLTASTQEDQPVAIKLLGSDPDNDPITFSLASSPAHGSVGSFDPATGSLVYTPLSDYSGSDTFAFKVTDSKGSAAAAAVTITVNAVEDAPAATNATLATDEDLTASIDLGLSISDPDGDAVSLANVTQPQHGTATIYPNNTVTYVPEPDFNGKDSLTYQATDGMLLSGVAHLEITVLSVNDAPRAMNLSVNTAEDTPVDVALINGTSDVDGDVSQLLIIRLPDNGIVSISDDNCTVTYVPNENFAGTDSFEYTLSDGVSSSNGTVAINVTQINDGPVIVDGALGSIVVEEDGSTLIDILSNVFDPEGDTLVITNVTQPGHGTVVINDNGTVTYTPYPDYNGPDTFGFTVDDGNGGIAEGTVGLTIFPVNDRPISWDTTASANEDSVLTFQLNATDSDGDSLNFTIVSIPEHGTAVLLDSSLGIVEYTPDANYNGGEALTFQATDGSADSAVAKATITISPVNDDPVANDDNYVGAEDTPMNLDVLADDYDIDGDLLAVEAIPAAPLHGMAAINPDGTITYTPEADYNGTDSFDYRVSDGAGAATATVMIAIGAVNDVPVASDGSASVTEDGSAVIMLNSTDSDNDPLQTAIISMPMHGTLEVTEPDGSLVRYIPMADYNGADSFSFQTSDGLADSNIATVSITVSPVNDSPVANGDNVMAQEDAAATIVVMANDQDIDGDSLSIVNATSAAHGNMVMAADGEFSYTPEPDYYGPDSFQYMLSDGQGGFALGSVTITVAPVDDAPVASDDWAYTTLSQPVFVKVLDNDTDIDSASLNVASVGTAMHGTVTIKPDGKGIVYTPAAGFSGDDQFQYTVTDGSMTDTATVTIQVYNIKFSHIQPPVGGGGGHAFEQGNTANVRLSLEDASGNDIVDAVVILRVQQLDANHVPIGPVMDASSAGGSNHGNVFDYSNSWYQYNLKTDGMAPGEWALYVYMLDGSREVLLEDPPIDGISTTIIVK